MYAHWSKCKPIDQSSKWPKDSWSVVLVEGSKAAVKVGLRISQSVVVLFAVDRATESLSVGSNANSERSPPAITLRQRKVGVAGVLTLRPGCMVATRMIEGVPC